MVVTTQDGAEFALMDDKGDARHGFYAL